MPLYTTTSFASPSLTGSPTAPTPSAGDNDTSIATTQFVQTEIAFRGALVTLSVDLTAINTTAGYKIPFDTEVYDTDSIHDDVTNNTRLTVPTGVTKVRLTGSWSVSGATSTTGTFHNAAIWKNDSGVYAGIAQQRIELTNTNHDNNLSSPVLSVVAGDYFELRVNEESDTSVTIEADYTWFAMEIIE